MKYKELPAFETNEFKEGDKIRVYYGEFFVNTNVETVNEHTIVFTDPIKGNYYAHFKQCRKLEEVKPREFIRHIDAFGNLYKYDDMSCDAKTEPVRPGPTRLIKLREVLDD